MRCFSEKTLQEYLDGEVSDTQRPRIEQHLARCSGCSHKLAGLGAAKNLAFKKLSLLDPPEIPAAPAITPRQKTHGLPERSPLRRFFAMTVRLPVAAAAMALLFVAGVSLGIFLRGSPALRLASRSQKESAPFYILSEKTLQAIPLALDLRGYQPIAQPQVIITQEETR